MEREEKLKILETLRSELSFLEGGGYGRSVRTPQKAKSTFIDSPTCLNFNELERKSPCASCALMPFVPEEKQEVEMPCHHIPLNNEGVTVATLEKRGNQEVAEEVLAKWLSSKIKKLEEELGLP